MIVYSVGKRIKNFFKAWIIKRDYGEEVKIIDGESLWKNPFKQVKKHGLVRWYHSNGKIKAECRYNDNKLEGISCFYYESGRLKAKENYKDNKLEGMSKKYYETGGVKSEEYYKKGTLLFKRVFDLNGDVTLISN
ncbi:MAG: hypothetical protein PVH88_10390 [Ignavibacteria bacterium]|jgi:antitoxin component YwqK of YwqJK toxin-antitoxin module